MLFPKISRRAALLALLAACWLSLAAPAHAGIVKFYKAKESDATFVSAGEKIKVWQFTPKDGDGPWPGVVMLYGLDCIDELPKSQWLYKNVAGMIADGGFVVHLVHYFNCTPFTDKEAKEIKKTVLGQVEAMKTKGLDPSLRKPYLAWQTAAKDGVEFLRQQKNVDKNRIGVVGLSMGGFVGTSMVVDHPELKVLAMANVFGGLPQEKFDKVRKEKLKLPPVLIMGAEDDTIVPEVFQRDLFQLLRDTGNRGEAHFYGDTGHAFVNKEGKFNMSLALTEALPVVVRFMKTHVQGSLPK